MKYKQDQLLISYCKQFLTGRSMQKKSATVAMRSRLRQTVQKRSIICS